MSLRVVKSVKQQDPFVCPLYIVGHEAGANQATSGERRGTLWAGQTAIHIYGQYFYRQYNKKIIFVTHMLSSA